MGNTHSQCRQTLVSTALLDAAMVFHRSGNLQEVSVQSIWTVQHADQLRLVVLGNSHHRRALAKVLLPSGLSTALQTRTSRIFRNLQNGVLNPVNMLR